MCKYFDFLVWIFSLIAYATIQKSIKTKNKSNLVDELNFFKVKIKKQTKKN